MRVTWLADVLRAAGQDVYEMPGARGRGRELRAVRGIVWHHTASGPNWQDGHVAALLRDGRRDLAGPLSQLGLERDGTWVIVADGRANHNGYGTWGNDSIGVEAYNSGVGERWSAAQYRAYVEGTAAILAHLGQNPDDNMLGHRETDPGRKIDPAGIDMNRARRDVGAHMARPGRPPTPPPGDDDMPLSDQDINRVALAAVAATDERFDAIDRKLKEQRGWLSAIARAVSAIAKVLARAPFATDTDRAELNKRDTHAELRATAGKDTA